MEQIAELRKRLKEEGIDYYIVPTADFHNSEYVGDYFKVRGFLSGFTGSAGTLVVSEKEAGLWTDGRYFVQAASQLEGTGITLYKMAEENVPTIEEYLEKNVKDGQVVGFDGRVMDAAFGKKLEKRFTLSYDKDVADAVWRDRPPLPATKVWIVPEKDCGMGVLEKLARVREKMAEQDAHHLVLSKLDDIMWLYNIRANDVDCNPVALSYTFVSRDSAVLFLQEEALTEEAKQYFNENNVVIKSYSEFTYFLEHCEITGKIWYAKEDINYLLYKCIEKRGASVDLENPTTLLKAVKTPVELEHIRSYYLG